jgi:hypothetical protein
MSAPVAVVLVRLMVRISSLRQRIQWCLAIAPSSLSDLFDGSDGARRIDDVARNSLDEVIFNFAAFAPF